MRLRTLALAVGCAVLVSAPLYASPKEELEQTQKEIEQSQAKQAKIAEDTDRLETELKVLQGNMVSLAESIQKSEAEMSDLEDKLRILDEQLKEKNIELKKHQKNLERLLQAALSLSYTPSEAMIMMPTNAMESMKTARALKMASSDIKKETQSIAQQMTELRELENKVKQNHDTLAARQTDLDKERVSLKGRIAERSDLLKKLGRERTQEAQKLAALAKKAKDLKELVGAVEKEAEHNESEKHAADLRSFVQAKGHIKNPVAGRMTQHFGVPQGKNVTSKGVVLTSRANARVVAPYDGEVVFTGPFLAYGQMVIIRHSDDFHTLLAGLSKIDVSEGQFLLEGEPIGAMGDGDSSRKLYIELRKNNQPIDPSQWIKGLGMSGLGKKKN